MRLCSGIVVLSGHFLYYFGWRYSKWIANCLDQLQFGLLYIYFKLIYLAPDKPLSETFIPDFSSFSW